MVGESVGSYKIVAKLGEGGMGVVYLAEHPLIGRKAAVKVLAPELSRRLDSVGRFFNEARSTTMLHHPGVVDIFDFGYHASGSAYIIMEYLEGSTLGSSLSRLGRLPLPWIVELTRQVALTLATAHAHGIVHRDLKPDNIFLVPDAAPRCGLRTKLLDFGIAKLVREIPLSKTRPGIFVGTPAYGSPEQCRGDEIDHRSDVYSLGCVVHEMAAGQPPFSGSGAGDVIAAHIFLPPPLLGDVTPPWLGALVHRMLAKDPNDRPTMTEIASAFDAAGEVDEMGAPVTAMTGTAPSPWLMGAQRTQLERTPGSSLSLVSEARAAARPSSPPTIPMPLLFPAPPSPTASAAGSEPAPPPETPPSRRTLPMPTMAPQPEAPTTAPIALKLGTPVMTTPGFAGRKRATPTQTPAVAAVASGAAAPAPAPSPERAPEAEPSATLFDDNADTEISAGSEAVPETDDPVTATYAREQSLRSPTPLPLPAPPFEADDPVTATYARDQSRRTPVAAPLPYPALAMTRARARRRRSAWLWAPPALLLVVAAGIGAGLTWRAQLRWPRPTVRLLTSWWPTRPPPAVVGAPPPPAVISASPFAAEAPMPLTPLLPAATMTLAPLELAAPASPDPLSALAADPSSPMPAPVSLAVAAPSATATPPASRASSSAAPAEPAAATAQLATREPPPKWAERLPVLDTVKVKLESRPSGASIFRDGDGVRIGRTPSTQIISRQPGQVTFLLRLAGYRPGRVSVSTGKDATRTITLVRARTVKRAAPASGSGGEDAAAGAE